MKEEFEEMKETLIFSLRPEEKMPEILFILSSGISINVYWYVFIWCVLENVDECAQ